ncbi:MAG: hypothetical protein L3J41_04050 [Melioribacteraceae bacterium]|nr:hypothetical protein [Melioribacteraceae bacterium]
MNLIFVHGWSVTDTETYGQLPEALEINAPLELELNIQHIYLGRYISFHDEVTVDDIARAFEKARKDLFGEDGEFSCITHSTGGPVIRAWVERFYGADNLSSLPLKHLIMLAPANHGSSLAQLGKARIGRIKSWFQGIEPGQGVLNWLELGSHEQRTLNLAWLDYKTANNGFFPVVITGETIDKKLYDYLNSYTAEKGSDGVVRVTSANLNYRYIHLKQNTSLPKLTLHDNDDSLPIYPLEQNGDIKIPLQRCALEVIPKASHSGEAKGIMRSVTKRNSKNKPIVKSVLESLQVNNTQDYEVLVNKMQMRMAKVQYQSKYTMIVVRVSDNQGNEITDYDLFFLAGNEYRMDKLPKGFFVDRQKNRINSCHLTYYLNDTKMNNIVDGKIGFRVVARPSEGFAYYSPGEFRSESISVTDLLIGNETLLLDIELKRNVDVHTFVADPLAKGRADFKKEKPKGVDVD